MPILKDIETRVVVEKPTLRGEKKYEPVQEWGIQTIGGGKKISSYIEAETGRAFRISIRPTIPYVSKDCHAAHSYETRERVKARNAGEETERPGFFKTKEKWQDLDGYPHHHCRQDHPLGQSNGGADVEKRRRSDSEHYDSDIKTKKEHDKEPTSFSPPTSASRNYLQPPPPPYHFLASLYLDGRGKPERRVVVYLDPNDEDFSSPDGKVTIKSRWAQGRDGNLKEQAWVFKDVGIETMFDKLIIAGDIDIATPILKRDEDALVNAMETAYVDGDADMIKEEKNKAGQILVIIERVKLGEKWRDHEFRAKHEEGENQDVNMEDASKEITHTTGFAHTKTIAAHPVRVVAYVPYKDGEGPYATFQFFYRSKETLAKFRFENFSANTPPRHRNKRFDNPFRTPLSICSNVVPSSVSINRKPGTFDQAVKNGSANKSPDTQFRFEPSYREQDRRYIKKKEKSQSPKRTTNLVNNSNLLVTSVTAPSRSDDGEDGVKRSNGQHYLCKPAIGSLSTPSPSPEATPSPQTKPLNKQGGSSAIFNLTTPSFNISHSSDLEDVSSTKPKTRWSGTPFNSGGTFRNTSDHTSDADDEVEKSDQETHHGSDTEWETSDENVPSANKDDQGLSIKVKRQLTLGKRSRSSDDSAETKETALNSNPIRSPEKGIGIGRSFWRRNALDVDKAGKIIEQAKKRAKIAGNDVSPLAEENGA